MIMSKQDPFAAFPSQVNQTAEASPLATNKLIRNTYILLSMTLMFSAVTAGISMWLELPRMGFLITIIGFFGLFYLTSKLKDSVWGIAAVFALTGFMGLSLGGIIEMYLTMFSNGSELVMMAFGSTAVIFLGLSGYALTSRKDFSFLGGFLFIGLIVAIVAMLVAWLFNIPGIQLGISAMIVLIMAGYILYDTSQMVHGYEQNYIMMTVALYLDIYNMFINLLMLFGFLGGDD